MNVVRNEHDIIVSDTTLTVFTQETKLVLPLVTVDHIKYFSCNANLKKAGTVDTIRLYTKDHVEIEAIRIHDTQVALKLFALLQKAVNESKR